MSNCGCGGMEQPPDAFNDPELLTIQYNNKIWELELYGCTIKYKNYIAAWNKTKDIWLANNILKSNCEIQGLFKRAIAFLKTTSEYYDCHYAGIWTDF